MPKLPKSLNDWSSERYARTIKNELQGMKPGSFPLEKGLTQGGQVDDSNITVTVFGSIEDDNQIQTKVTVFFTEIVGGCSCGDAPFEAHAHATLMVTINKLTAETTFEVIPD